MNELRKDKPVRVLRVLEYLAENEGVMEKQIAPSLLGCREGVQGVMFTAITLHPEHPAVELLPPALFEDAPEDDYNKQMARMSKVRDWMQPHPEYWTRKDAAARDKARRFFLERAELAADGDALAKVVMESPLSTLIDSLIAMITDLQENVHPDNSTAGLVEAAGPLFAGVIDLSNPDTMQALREKVITKGDTLGELDEINLEG